MGLHDDILDPFKNEKDLLFPKNILRSIEPPSLPDMSSFKPIAQSLAEDEYASEFHRRLISWIRDFDKSLDQEHEVGVRLVNFGQTVEFHLEDIGYWNPSLISFTGKTEDGEPVELIQHVSQISVLLKKLSRKDLSKPKQPIGFASEQKEDEGKGDGAESAE